MKPHLRRGAFLPDATRSRSSAAVLVLTVIGAASLGAPVLPGSAQGDPGAGPMEWLVGLQPGLSPATASLQVSALGRVLSTHPELGVVRVRLDPAADRTIAIARLRKLEGVAFLEPNSPVRAFRLPNDPMFSSSQYGPQQIGADAAWDLWQPQARITVGVLDTGVDYAHADLAPGLVRNASGTVVARNTLTGGATAVDDHGHGSHVAGILAARTDNGVGIAGIAGWNPRDPEVASPVRILAVKVLDNQAQGSQLSLADGIRWAAEQGARVLNMSLGGAEVSLTVQRAVEYADSRGCVLVAAAGNTSTPTPNYPAAYPDVLSVGASDAGDVLALFSSHGPWVRCTAPGVGIWSTVPGSYFGADGTSMAAPHVAGAAAVLLSHDPGLTPAGIRSLLQATRSSVTLPADRTLAPGAGRVNLGEALRKLGTPAVLSEVTTGQARLVHSGVGTGRVRLTSAAGEGGALVALTCDPVGILRVPAAVLVGPGEQSAEFTFAVHAPAGATYATLHATYRGRTQSVRVLVTPSEASLTTLEVLQIPLTAGSPGTGLVALNLPAPSPGADILLQSSSQAVRVPVAVRIPAGDKSVGFPISTAIAASPVTARLAASWQGTSVQADAPVLPRLESLAIEPTSVPGGNTTEGRLTLRMAAARGGVPVRLSVSDRRYVSLPATVRVPAGATQVRFTIRTRRVRVSQSVELQATLDGAVRRARLDLTP